MPRARPAAPKLDELIDEITVDCHDDDEQLMAFSNAFEEADFPHPGRVIGEKVEVLSAGAADARTDLVANCKYHGRTYQIALLDVEIDADPDTTHLIAAYRRWTALRW